MSKIFACTHTHTHKSSLSVGCILAAYRQNLWQPVDSEIYGFDVSFNQNEPQGSCQFPSACFFVIFNCFLKPVVHSFGFFPQKKTRDFCGFRFSVLWWKHRLVSLLCFGSHILVRRWRTTKIQSAGFKAGGSRLTVYNFSPLCFFFKLVNNFHLAGCNCKHLKLLCNS